MLSNTPWIRNLSKDDILIIFEEMYLSDFKEYYELKKYEGDVRVYGKEDIRTVFTQDQFDRENEFDLQYLRLLRNEIFARKGMAFKDPDLDQFFRAMPWYNGDSTFNNGTLNQYERKNIEIIINEENICRAQNDTAEIINVDLHFRDIFKKKVYIGNKYVYRVKDLDNKRPRNKMYARLLLNEIYARHGLIFKSFLMKSFFEPFTWYEPKVTLVTDFNEYENQNILLLKKYLHKE